MWMYKIQWKTSSVLVRMVRCLHIALHSVFRVQVKPLYAVSALYTLWCRKCMLQQYFSIRKIFHYLWLAWHSILQLCHVQFVCICRGLKSSSDIWNSYINWQMLTQKHWHYVYGWFIRGFFHTTYFQTCKLFTVESFNHCESEFIYTTQISWDWAKGNEYLILKHKYKVVTAINSYLIM